jgi:hypothetical protein
MSSTQSKAAYIEPMLLLRTESLPDGGSWLPELKLDGHRAVAYKTGSKVHPRSPQRQGVQESEGKKAKRVSRFPLTASDLLI